MREDVDADPSGQEEAQQSESSNLSHHPEASSSSSSYPPMSIASSSSGPSRGALLPPPPPPPTSTSSSAAPAGRSLLSSWGAATAPGAAAGGSRLLTPPPPGRRSLLQTGSSNTGRARPSRTMEMLRSFSSTSSASDEEAALDATAGETSTLGGTAARSQVPRRSIAHNPSFLAEAGYSGAGSSSSSAPRGRGGPLQASSSAGLPPPPSPGFGGPPAEWDEVDLEFDVDLEMARNGSSGGTGAEGSRVRGGRVRSLSGRGEGGEQVPMQKLGSNTGRSNTTRGGSQLQESRTDKETDAVADGTGTGAEGATSSSMGEYDATPKPSMDVRLPPAGEEEGDGALRGLLSEGPGGHRRTTSTSSSQGKPSKTQLLDSASSGSGSDAVRRAEVDSNQPGPPSYTPRARTLEEEIGYDPSLAEGEDEDEDEDGDEDATTPTARHLDRSYLDSSSAGRGSPSRLDFEPLTRREKWTHALTAVVVTVLAGLAVAIGGDLIDWPGDGIGDS